MLRAWRLTNQLEHMQQLIAKVDTTAVNSWYDLVRWFSVIKNQYKC